MYVANIHEENFYTLFDNLISYSFLTDSVMHDAYRYEVREVDYDFKSVNSFKGAPIEDIEKEWTYLMNGGRKT